MPAFVGCVLAAALGILALAGCALGLSVTLTRLVNATLAARQRGSLVPKYVAFAALLLTLFGVVLAQLGLLRVPDMPSLEEFLTPAPSPAPPPPPPAPPPIGGRFASPRDVPMPGDWSLIRVGEHGDRDILFCLEEMTRDKTTLRVARTDRSERSETLAARADEFLPYEKLSALLGSDVCPRLEDVRDTKTEKVRLRVEDTDFFITKISFTGARAGGERGVVVLWFSELVRFPCLYAIDFFGTRVVQVVGFGSGQGGYWGRVVDDFPFNPFARAEEGDWAAVSYQSPSATWTELFFVEKVRMTTVTLGWRRRASDQSVSRPEPLHFHNDRTPALSPLFDPHWGVPDLSVAAVASQSVVLPVGGRDFPCMKLSYTLPGARERKGADVSLWFSGDVKIWGLVALEIVEPAIKAELVGYGTKTETLFGSKPDW